MNNKIEEILHAKQRETGVGKSIKKLKHLYDLEMSEYHKWMEKTQKLWERAGDGGNFITWAENYRGGTVTEYREANKCFHRASQIKKEMDDVEAALNRLATSEATNTHPTSYSQTYTPSPANIDQKRHSPLFKKPNPKAVPLMIAVFIFMLLAVILSRSGHNIIGLLTPILIPFGFTWLMCQITGKGTHWWSNLLAYILFFSGGVLLIVAVSGGRAGIAVFGVIVALLGALIRI